MRRQEWDGLFSWCSPLGVMSNLTSTRASKFLTPASKSCLSDNPVRRALELFVQTRNAHRVGTHTEQVCVQKNSTGVHRTHVTDGNVSEGMRSKRKARDSKHVRVQT